MGPMPRLASRASQPVAELARLNWLSVLWRRVSDVRLSALVALLVVLFGCVGLPAVAAADGDPGSDVLLDQSLFYGADAGVTVKQELGLDRLLNATSSAGAPVRVALIAHPDDLGTVTALWNKPQTYANYLGYELSLAYTGRLLIVMPSGVGVYWHANPAGAAKLAASLSRLKPASAAPSALVGLAQSAVYRVEAAAGVEGSALAGPHGRETAAPSTSASAGVSAPAAASTRSRRSRGNGTSVAWILALLVLMALIYAGWRTKGLERLRNAVGAIRTRGGTKARRLRAVALLPTVLLGVVVAALLVNQSNNAEPTATGATLATNPHLDPGTWLGKRQAPDFTLVGQTGQRVSLSQYRGKAVILAFTDAECQTICPLTTQAMVDAKQDLGKAGNRLQLLGINANWKSTQIDDVLNYSELHGMMGRWQFATGSSTQLERVWKAYGVNEKALVTKADNEIDHVAALYVIDPEGRERVLFTTYPSYASVPQFGQLLAQDVSRLLPSHPAVATRFSYAEAPATLPTVTTKLRKLGGGKVALGPGKPHLYLFFATWDRQTIGLGADLDELNSYERAARAKGLPQMTAIDEGSVEPSAGALPAFISTLARPLSYPVAIDHSGRVADGYGVEGEPWFVLTDAAGKIVWYQEVYTQGWPKTLTVLEQEIADSLAKTGSSPGGASRTETELAGSPGPLAAIHKQASQILPGGQDALDARIKKLRSEGYSVVLNIWASWCQPCQEEFGLFAQASALYGKDVAFLGADVEDNAADAQAFLKQHHVSYPSYEVTSTSIDKILVGGLEGTPTTVFISPLGGKFIHPYNYTSLGALQADIEGHALGTRG